MIISQPSGPTCAFRPAVLLVGALSEEGLAALFICASADRRPPDRHPAAQAWEAVEQVLTTHYFDPDLQAARALYSAVAAHFLPGQPVWIMAVAPPGSMKTELLNAFDPTPHFHFIDTLTANTLLSGQIKSGKRDRPPSLLHRIGPTGVLVFKDFSTVLGLHPLVRSQIIADLRCVYDGKLTKEKGTAEQDLVWAGRLTFLTGCTPHIDEHFSMVQALGERWLMVRWPRAGGESRGR